MIIETCPKCGGALECLVIAILPPIPARRCPKCGWSWEGKPQWDKVICVPFEPPKEADND